MWVELNMNTSNKAELAILWLLAVSTVSPAQNKKIAFFCLLCDWYSAIPDWDKTVVRVINFRFIILEL